ncbi:MAG: hypothetical protein ACFFB0_10150 [Promethearchaeota archaeon]
MLNRKNNDNELDVDVKKTPKLSKLIGEINLTNYWINETTHPHDSIIPIEGKIYKPVPPPPPYDNLSGVNVAIVVDGNLDTNYTAQSNGDGEFQINYRIPFKLDIYLSHKIEVECIDDLGNDDIFPINFFIIYVNATSIFDISYRENIPKLPGEDFRIEGFLRYDNMDGDGIPDAQINYNWYNGSHKWPMGSFFTNSFGSLLTNLPIPFDAYSQIINLNLSYPGILYLIGNSEIAIPKIQLFTGVIWQNIEIPTRASEGDNITISGQIISRDNTTLKLYNRTVLISYEGTQVDTIETDSDGYFTTTYTIRSGAGNRTIRISLDNTAGLDISIEHYINVTAAIYVPIPSSGQPPFFLFSVIFFPILAVIMGVLIVYGIRYYKKQEKGSRVVNLPLESKLINLKILKDTGRLEESLSYLFNAIFMDLINAKYGRTRKETETIRDFAIISVKELKLTPAAIYPFIQKVEEVIYAKPFKITENDFYETCGLFSPIYFQLTGYNFVLNF